MIGTAMMNRKVSASARDLDPFLAQQGVKPFEGKWSPIRSESNIVIQHLTINGDA